jgi:hypothetical protein
MTAAATPAPPWPEAHRQFEAALPRMDHVFRFRLRRLPRGRHEDALAEARAAAWAAWHGLIRRGKDPRAVGPTGIANNVARFVNAGRRLGTGTAGRAARDVYDPRARRLGVKLLRLDHGTGADGAPRSDAWREWLAEDHRVNPADEAAFRIDFAAWLGRLPARKRQMAELLALGHQTGGVARRLGVTPGAVSQTRAWLGASWQAFQAGTTTGEGTVRKRVPQATAAPPGPYRPIEDRATGTAPTAPAVAAAGGRRSFPQARGI